MFKFYFLSPPHQVWEARWRDASCCWLDHHSWIHAFRRGGLGQRINWCLNSMSRRHRPSPNKHKGIIVATHACSMFFFTVFPPKKDKFIFALPCRKQQLALRCRLTWILWKDGHVRPWLPRFSWLPVSWICQSLELLRSSSLFFKVLDRAWMIPCTATWKIFNFKCFLWQKCSHQDFPHFCPTNHQLFKNNFLLT